MPWVVALFATWALPTALRGPVACVQGLVFLIRSACARRRSGGQPFEVFDIFGVLQFVLRNFFLILPFPAQQNGAAALALRGEGQVNNGMRHDFLIVDAENDQSHKYLVQRIGLRLQRTGSVGGIQPRGKGQQGRLQGAGFVWIVGHDDIVGN